MPVLYHDNLASVPGAVRSIVGLQREELLPVGRHVILPAIEPASGDSLSLNFTFDQPAWADLAADLIRTRLARHDRWREVAMGVLGNNPQLRARAEATVLDLMGDFNELPGLLRDVGTITFETFEDMSELEKSEDAPLRYQRVFSATLSMDSDSITISIPQKPDTTIPHEPALEGLFRWVSGRQDTFGASDLPTGGKIPMKSISQFLNTLVASGFLQEF